MSGCVRYGALVMAWFLLVAIGMPWWLAIVVCWLGWYATRPEPYEKGNYRD